MTNETYNTDDALFRLRSFNRKERFFVMANAIAGTADVNLSTLMRDRLELALAHDKDDEAYMLIKDGGLANAHVFVDYHLDWIATALLATELTETNSLSVIPRDNRIKGSAAALLNGGQEDIDLLVVGHDEKQNRLFLYLVEAKFDTGWGWKQLSSKIARIKQILDGLESVGGHDSVVASFLLAGPVKEGSTDRWLDEWSRIVLQPPTKNGALKALRVVLESRTFCRGWKWVNDETALSIPAVRLDVGATPGADDAEVTRFIQPTRTDKEPDTKSDYKKVRFESIKFLRDQDNKPK